MALKPTPSRVDELFQRAHAALSTDATRESATKLEQRLQPLAAELFLEWLVGEKRFENQSQQTEYWLSRFYDEIFIDEQPDATRIYTRFGLPLARAGYVARLLRARATTTWRKAARVELKKRLNDNKASALQEKKDGQAHIIEYDIGLSTGAADELRVMYDRSPNRLGLSRHSAVCVGCPSQPRRCFSCSITSLVKEIHDEREPANHGGPDADARRSRWHLFQHSAQPVAAYAAGR